MKPTLDSAHDIFFAELTCALKLCEVNGVCKEGDTFDTLSVGLWECIERLLEYGLDFFGDRDKVIGLGGVPLFEVFLCVERVAFGVGEDLVTERCVFILLEGWKG